MEKEKQYLLDRLLSTCTPEEIHEMAAERSLQLQEQRAKKEREAQIKKEAKLALLQALSKYFCAYGVDVDKMNLESYIPNVRPATDDDIERLFRKYFH